MHSASPNDTIRRLKIGDTSSFVEIVLKFQHRIYNLCRHMLGHDEDAEDAAQDTFLKAYRKLEDFKPEASLYAWLYRIAVNTCLDYKRKKARTPLNEGVPVEEVPSADPGLQGLYELKEITAFVQHALQQLPKKLKAVMVLREMEGLSYDEIAEVLGLSVGTVKSRISRARKELRRLLQGRL